MLRNKKTEKEKELRRLAAEYDELWRQNEGHYVDVEPYQQGWYRYFVLRDDIRNRKDAQDIRQVLDKINEYCFSSRKDFTEWDYKEKKRVPMKQIVRTLDEKTYESLSEKHRSYFSRYISWNKFWRRDEVRYMFKYDYWFVFQTVPRMVTRHWITDGAWATRLAEVKNKLNRDNLWPKIYKSRGDKYSYRGENFKYHLGEFDDYLTD